MRFAPLRRAVPALLTFALLGAMPKPAHAQDYRFACHGADLTLDGRWLVVRPLCVPVAAIDLTTGEVAGRERARALATTGAVWPLAPITAHGPDDALGAWLTQIGTAVDEAPAALFFAYALPGTDWIVRFRASGEARTHISDVELGLRAAFEAERTRHVAVPRPRTLPRLGPFTPAAPVADAPTFAAIFRPAEPERRLAWGTLRKLSYDPIRFARRVPSLVEFLHEARWVYELGPTIGFVPKAPGTSGWRVDAPPAGGFWAALDLGAGGFRLVHNDDDGSANEEPLALYAALAEGRSFKLRTYRGGRWTVVVLVPRTPP